MNARVLICAAVAAGALPLPASAAGSAALEFPKIAAAPAIDGTLNDPAWKRAAKISLRYNLRTHAGAAQSTTAYVFADDAFVYVGFDARQIEPVRATQHTNDVGCCVDDSVQIDLWPNGSSGFRYLFIASPNGTRYQYSSENNVYEPQWWAAGKIVPGGYVVTMKVPLGVMRGTSSGDWRVQFARVVQATNDDIVWSYGAPQQNHNDVHYAAPASGLPHLAAQHAKLRAGIYALGAIASRAAGGPTSRAGADLSIPIAAGTSFVATMHPDFSDVEVDQQSISPTAFTRTINEVRPFFTQGANFYNTTGYCQQCPASQLYTPNIPTPREGFALEGQRGLFSYAAFDSIGIARRDTAQVLNYLSPDQSNHATIQHDGVDTSGMKDDALQASYIHDNLKNLAAWIRYGDDAGSNVVAGNQAQRYEGGMQWYTPTSAVAFTLRKIGAYYNPVDGYVNQPDIAGYDIDGQKTLRFASNAKVKEIDLSANVDRYHAHAGGLSQGDQWLLAQVLTRNLWSFSAEAGSAYLRLSNGLLSPATGNSGVEAVYHYGTATPTLVEFETGRFGPGRLNTWIRTSTMQIGTRGSLTLELDDTAQFIGNKRYTQWLERAGFSYQGGPEESFSFGVRRIIGTPPMLAAIPVFQNGSNISAAFHRKTAAGEFYAVYGDASAFSTAPQFLLKFIRYVGGEKGT